MQWQDRGPDGLRYTERDFKVCDFCGALNPVSNAECFVCKWSGMFRTDRETVGEALRLLESDFGDLSESLFAEEIVPSALPRPGVWTRFWKSVRRSFGRA